MCKNQLEGIENQEKAPVILLAFGYDLIKSQVSDEYIGVLSDFPNVAATGENEEEVKKELQFKVFEALKNYEYHES